jgi:sec-independent protein translocase protein TatA
MDVTKYEEGAMPELGVPELLIIAVIVLLLFGPGKAADIGSSLGKSIREFRRATSEDDGPAPTAAAATQLASAAAGGAVASSAAAAEGAAAAGRFCIECGTQAQAGQQFCANCGAAP